MKTNRNSYTITIYRMLPFQMNLSKWNFSDADPSKNGGLKAGDQNTSDTHAVCVWEVWHCDQSQRIVVNGRTTREQWPDHSWRQFRRSVWSHPSYSYIAASAMTGAHSLGTRGHGKYAYNSGVAKRGVQTPHSHRSCFFTAIKLLLLNIITSL